MTIRNGWPLVFLTIATMAVAGTGGAVAAEAQAPEQSAPVYPVSELRRGSEGWVIVQYAVDVDGSVASAVVRHSSGSSKFEQAALDAVLGWRFEPGEARQSSAQINFVFERRSPQVSKTFYRKLRRIHESIELGQLDAAAAAIRSMRRKGAPNAFENAYLLIAEGRIAGQSGDRGAQIDLFRLASLSQGRWLARSDYLRLLHGMTLLELQAENYSAALAHYLELSRTSPGRQLAADLEPAMRVLEARLMAGRGTNAGYREAEQLVTVVRDQPQTPGRGRAMDGFGQDDGFRPQPSPPAESEPSQGATD